MPLFDPDESLSAIEEDSPSGLFLLTFDGNGNDGGTPPPANDYPEGHSVTLPGNIGSLTKSSESFIGWNTQADGLGTSYAVGSVFVMPPAPVTLYAHWTSLPTYTVTYDANSPTSGTAPANQTKVQGIDLPLASNTGGLARTGFTFTGWNTANDGSGTSYAEGATYTADADETLYAEWTALPTYTVSYDANAADSGTAPANQTKTAGIDLTLATNSGTLARTGYTFAGWNTATDGSGTSYAEGATYTADADETLYAEWTALPTYTVTYNANAADSGTAPANQTKTAGIDLTLATNSGTLARTGYTFAGWNTATDGSGTSYAEGATYTADADVTLYAEWLPTYTVSYDANSADSGTAPANQTKIQGIDLTLASNTGVLARTGFAFSGWNTATDGSGTSYAEGATYTADANLTLYAEWVPLFAGGDGSPGNPYQINSPEGLDAIRLDLAADYELVTDVDLGVSPYNTGQGWEPIGTPTMPFVGTFDGQGFAVRNLWIDRPATDHVGLFGFAEDTVVSNVTLENVNVVGQTYVGALVGETGVTGSFVNDVSVTGTVTSSGGDNVGGLIGWHQNVTTERIFGDVTLTCTGSCSQVGGLIGRLNSGSVDYAFLEGTVTGDDYVGGVTGYLRGALRDSYSLASVTALTGRAGGIAGYSSGVLLNAYTSGSVTGPTAGGLIGENDGGALLGNPIFEDSLPDNGVGSPETTATMQTLTLYSGFGWDIDTDPLSTSIWTIDVGSSFPYFGWQPVGTGSRPP